MFQHYTERARRVIFFARFEASQYGSPCIETEHFLLGLLREDRALAQRFLGDSHEPAIRTEIERSITVRERISTSVEMPLTEECKKILNFAAEEAERLGHRQVGTEHLLLALLRVEGSLAARILHAKGLRLDKIREELPKITVAEDVRAALLPGYSLRPPDRRAFSRLEEFLVGLKWDKGECLLLYFAANARFVDVQGRPWNREEIEKEFAALFAPYAKKNAAYIIEQTLVDSNDTVVVTVLWKNAILASMERIWIHRMSVVLIREHAEWVIVLMQVTPVQAV